jgi:hypothetical protein
MGSAIPTGAAGGRSPNPDHGHHGRCRCRWRAARRKDMRLRTGGSACEREREQRYAREQRPRAVDVPRAGRGREAHDPCTRPRVRPRCTAAAAVGIAASDVYPCSPLLVSLAFSTVSWPYRVAEAHISSFGPDIFTFTPPAPRSYFIGGRRRNSDDATRAAPIRGAVAVSSVGWPDRSFRQLLSTQSGLRDQ